MKEILHEVERGNDQNTTTIVIIEIVDAIEKVQNTIRVNNMEIYNYLV